MDPLRFSLSYTNIGERHSPLNLQIENNWCSNWIFLPRLSFHCCYGNQSTYCVHPQLHNNIVVFKVTLENLIIAIHVYIFPPLVWPYLTIRYTNTHSSLLLCYTHSHVYTRHMLTYFKRENTFYTTKCTHVSYELWERCVSNVYWDLYAYILNGH